MIVMIRESLHGCPCGMNKERNQGDMNEVGSTRSLILVDFRRYLLLGALGSWKPKHTVKKPKYTKSAQHITVPN